MKIAFHLSGDSRWPAGAAHLEGLLHALRLDTAGRPRLAVIPPHAGARLPEELEPLVDEVLPLRDFPRGSLPWVTSRFSERLLGRDVTSDGVLRKHGVSVVALGDVRFRSRLPNICWIHDFQHRRLPEFFSAEESRRRDEWFAAAMKQSDRVLLLSSSVLLDFREFLPAYVEKARVLRPVSHVPASVYEQDPAAVCARYDIPERFLYMPTGFLKHKNHLLVWEALRILKERGQRPHVVCTGHPGDFRDPAHYPMLLDYLEKWGLRDQVSLLGLVPREQLWKLMRQSLCVLSASLFEGFGLGVDEARSLGKSLLVSDIPPHREQQPRAAAFFDPQDSEELARLLTACSTKPPGPDEQLETAARSELTVRQAGYAREFMAVAGEIAV